MGWIRDSDWSPERLQQILDEMGLAYRNGPPVLAKVIRYLRHPWPEVREAILMILAEREPRQELLPTLEAMVNDPVARNVKVILTDVLARYGAQSEPVLLRLLKDSWWEVRDKAVWNLKRVGGNGALPALQDLAENDPEHLVRISAAEVIQAIRHRSLDCSVADED